MCTNYVPPSHDELRERFRVDRYLTEIPYKAETWPDYNAPVIVDDNGARAAIVANYGFIPKRKIPPGAKKYSTMNSRSETVGTLPQADRLNLIARVGTRAHPTRLFRNLPR